MTQQQKILTIMCRQPDKWFYPYEFMMPELGDLFVGYKAPTRIAELHKAYPEMFNTRTVDKYVQRKINVEGILMEKEFMTEDLREVFDREAINLPSKSVRQSLVSNLKAISWLKDEE